MPMAGLSNLMGTSLYVGDLHPETSEHQITETFSKIGQVASTHLCKDSISGQSLRYAYVNFFSNTDASKAIESLNHTYLNGKPMRIMWLYRNPYLRKTGIANLFVKNLDLSVDGVELEKIFNKYGRVLSCKVAEENGKSKGFGFVQFDSEESAQSAMSALHDTIIHAKKIYVSKFVKKAERLGDSEGTNLSNLYVKNLDLEFTADSLRDKFSQFGTVDSCVVMKDEHGKSKGFGFVNFESPEDAKKAMEAMNGTQLGSKNVFVSKAQKKAERQQMIKKRFQESRTRLIEKFQGSNVYVKYLAESVDDDKLRDYFSFCGKIISVKVMKNHQGTTRGFGFVCFSCPDEANKAVTSLNGSLFHGRLLRVAIAQRKEDRAATFQCHMTRSLQEPVPYYSPNYYATPKNVIPNIPFQPLLYQHYSGSTTMPLSPSQQVYSEQSCIILTSPIQSKSRQSPKHDPVSTYICSLQGMEYQKSMGYIEMGNFPSYKFGSLEFQKKSPSKTTQSVFPESRMLLANVAPEQKKKIEHYLFPLVQKLQPNHAEKITRTLMKMSNIELFGLLDSPDLLASKVNDVVKVLKKEKPKNCSLNDNANLKISPTDNDWCLVDG